MRAGLDAPEGGVEAAGAQELLMGPGLAHAPVLQHRQRRMRGWSLAGIRAG